MRRGGAAPAAPALPGPAAQGGGAGPAGGTGQVPARLARDRGGSTAARCVAAAAAAAGRRRGGAGGGGAAGRGAGARVRAGDAGPARADTRLLPRPARRAHLGGRGRLVRRGSAARRRRLAGAGARRRRPADAARTGRGQHDPAARGGARGAQRRRRAVLPDAQRPCRGAARRLAARRQRGGGGDLGPGVGRAAHQRHPGPAAGGARRPAAAGGRAAPGGGAAAPAGRSWPALWLRPPRDAHAYRPADGQRPVVAAAGSPGASLPVARAPRPCARTRWP